MAHPEKPQETSRSISERVYGKLLFACPKEFRKEHGPQIAQTFGDLCNEKRHSGTTGLTRLWLRALPDLATTAIVERSKTMGLAMTRAGRQVTLSNLMLLNGVVLLIIGAAFATVPDLVQLYGAELSWDANDASRGYAVFGFARLFGFLCMGYGLLLFAASRVAETEVRKLVAGVLASVNTFAAVYLLGAQMTMWETTVGWITIAVHTFFALGYGFFWTTGNRISGAPSPVRRAR